MFRLATPDYPPTLTLPRKGGGNNTPTNEGFPGSLPPCGGGLGWGASSLKEDELRAFITGSENPSQNEDWLQAFEVPVPVL
jgi:hypothetical protein